VLRKHGDVTTPYMYRHGYRRAVIAWLHRERR
jgi:hypothetical protein